MQLWYNYDTTTIELQYNYYATRIQLQYDEMQIECRYNTNTNKFATSAAWLSA